MVCGGHGLNLWFSFLLEHKSPCRQQEVFRIVLLNAYVLYPFPFDFRTSPGAGPDRKYDPYIFHDPFFAIWACYRP